MDRVRIGIVGVGNIATLNVPGYLAHEQCDVVALCDPRPDVLDRRVRDFTKAYDLSPTQVRQLREVLHDHDQRKERIRQLTPEQFQELRALEAESRGRIRQLLTEEQQREYDTRARPR